MPGRASDKAVNSSQPWSATPTGMTYRKYLRAAGRSSGTIDQRMGDIDRLARALGEPLNATQEQLVSYLAVRHARSAPEYRKKLRSSLRVFFSWAMLNQLVDVDPAAALPTVNVPRAKPHPVPDDVLLRAYQDAPLPVRAMLLLGGTIGLRRTEIASAHPGNRRGKHLTVLGKGAVSRVVPLDDLTLATLRELEAEQGTNVYYFPGRFGGFIHPSTAYRWVRNEVGPEWTLHSLRHRAGTVGYRGTLDLRATQELLGHSSPNTTQTYVAISDEALEAVVAAAALPLDGATEAARSSITHRARTDRVIVLDLDAVTIADVHLVIDAALSSLSKQRHDDGGLTRSPSVRID